MTIERPTEAQQAFETAAKAYTDTALFESNKAAIKEALKAQGLKGEAVNSIALKLQSIMSVCGRFGWSLAATDKQCGISIYAGKEISVTMSIMWRAWALLARRQGLSVSVGTVREGDHFKINKAGLDYESDPFSEGAVKGWFAELRKDGDHVSHAVMSVADLEKRKAKSSRKNQYVDWADEMAYAKVMRIACERGGLMVKVDPSILDEYEPTPDEVAEPSSEAASEPSSEAQVPEGNYENDLPFGN